MSRGRVFAYAFHFQGFCRVEKFGVFREPSAPDVIDDFAHRLGGFAFKWESGLVYAVGAPMWFLTLIFWRDNIGIAAASSQAA